MADETLIQEFAKRAQSAEEEIVHLKKKIATLKSKVASEAENTPIDQKKSPEVDRLTVENTKLEYQINQLKRFIEEEKAKSSCIMTNTQFILNELFKQAIRVAFPAVTDPPILVQSTQNDKFGDYQCNSAMGLSQILKNNGQKANPQAIAKSIIASLPPNDLIEKVGMIMKK
ncbi:predicted protein [Nematostella vectensis]|uniref:arginine--tRNA ligase n=1 Tax=Nematostella vectensis TaxID=45351 RepID=A7S643_NEMVE|nr:predicted protein [Nematostella vectensis]|eukprot:XP_001632818.1 predicted protein [Nematostella vectensis]